ncbi:MAG: ABC transporter ATP-binding protein [Pseudobdellovibrionaceae bacterium]
MNPPSKKGVDIQVQGLKKRLGNTQALDGISLEFNAGLIHGVIGPEGAGKTTLFRHLAGLLRADDGNIEYFENHTRVDFQALRPRIAYMPQTQSLYPDLSIQEHLDFFRELYDLQKNEYEEKRDRLLSITRLQEFVDRPARDLSGGMYKKLGLMCALLASPQALLLDEPTNGVDPISRREFWQLLYDLQSQNILILVATAYMDEAERCEKVHLLNEGRVIGSGEPRVLLKEKGARSFDEYFLSQGGDFQ